MKKYFKFYLSIIILNIIFVCNTAYADTAKNLFDKSLGISADKSGYSMAQKDGEGYIIKLAGTAIKYYFLGFLGIAFLLLTIWAGYLWMTARGNEQQVEKAKTVIIDTVIGLIIVLAAYAIVRFFGENLVKITF
jgi:hypothetical protein